MPTAAPLPSLEETLGHHFAEPALLREALRHRSAQGVRSGRQSSNERLEFVGDRVLALIVAEWLAERFPRESEGDWGKRLSHLVAGATVGGIAERLGLGEHLLMPDEESRAGVRERSRVLADGMEAVLGAMFLDGGLAPARGFIRRAWAPVLDDMKVPPQPPKTALQEWAHAKGLAPPAYRVVTVGGPSHAPLFHATVALDEREAVATGSSKREAEQEAARLWLEGLGA